MRGTSIDDPSGHALAEAAYDAGAVEPADSLGSCDLSLSLVVRGDAEHVSTLAQQLTLELIARSDVERVDYAVSER